MVVLGEKNFILKPYNFDLDHMISVSILGLLIFHKLRESKNKTSNPGSQDRLREDIPRITHNCCSLNHPQQESDVSGEENNFYALKWWALTHTPRYTYTSQKLLLVSQLFTHNFRVLLRCLAVPSNNLVIRCTFPKHALKQAGFLCVHGEARQISQLTAALLTLKPRVYSTLRRGSLTLIVNEGFKAHYDWILRSKF